MDGHHISVMCDGRYGYWHNIEDVVSHFFGCVDYRQREKFFQNLAEGTRERIQEDVRRIARVRARFAAEGERTDSGKLLKRFKGSLSQWRSNLQGLRHQQMLVKEFTDLPLEESEEPEADLNASMIWYKDCRPYSHPKFPGTFPDQKHNLSKLLFEKNHQTNPLMVDCNDGEIRYFNLPANNTYWIEVSRSFDFAGSLCN